MMLYIRAQRGSDWLLHLHAVSMIMTLFFLLAIIMQDIIFVVVAKEFIFYNKRQLNVRVKYN